MHQICIKLIIVNSYFLQQSPSSFCPLFKKTYIMPEIIRREVTRAGFTKKMIFLTNCAQHRSSENHQAIILSAGNGT